MSTRKRTHIALIFGGRSGEHEVSLMSARSVLSVLDPAKYEVTQIGITLAGQWLVGEDVIGKFEQKSTAGLEPAVVLADPSGNGVHVLRKGRLERLTNVDVFFPLLHGTFGEDGTIQGLFEMADAAYVGAGVVGSSVGMDKGLFKDVMRANDIPSVASMIVLRAELEKDMQGVLQRAEAVAPYPLFTKPANLGSSVGVTKCRSRSDLQEGLMEAALYDRRVLVERGVANVREIEVSVLGNDDPRASVPGEILPSREFYSYESKYVDGTSGLIIPAPLPQEQSARVQELAVRAFKAIDAAGMARVDFFLDKDTNELYLNELNTIPGFTKISMYPKLWEATGMPYAELVDRLIELALQRKSDRDRTSHTLSERWMRDAARRNRSEIVRHRRKQEASKRLENSAVMSRHVGGADHDTQHGGRARGTARSRPAVRRRKDAAFSMPGIEVHMPTISFSGQAAKWRFVSFGLSLLLGAALYLAGTSPFFRAASPRSAETSAYPPARSRPCWRAPTCRSSRWCLEICSNACG